MFLILVKVLVIANKKVWTFDLDWIIEVGSRSNFYCKQNQVKFLKIKKKADFKNLLVFS